MVFKLSYVSTRCKRRKWRRRFCCCRMWLQNTSFISNAAVKGFQEDDHVVRPCQSVENATEESRSALSDTYFGGSRAQTLFGVIIYLLCLLSRGENFFFKIVQQTAERNIPLDWKCWKLELLFMNHVRKVGSPRSRRSSRSR